MFDDCIILAGGAGTRLWPASSAARPKQFLPLPNDKTKTFFHAALSRAFAVTDAAHSRIIIMAGKAHIERITSICAEYGRARRIVLIPEASAKNTAAALACAAVFAEATAGTPRTTLVLASDHVIGPEAVFAAQAEALGARVRRGGIGLFGIAPRTAETAYGYIEAAREEPSAAEGGFFAVTSFREKPDKQTAEGYLAAGRFYWNSGMFAYSTGYVLDEFRKHAADILLPFERLPAPPSASDASGGLRVVEDWRGLDEAYGAVRSAAFDTAIVEKVEKCGGLVMAKAAFGWSDAGSWDEYARLSGGNAQDVFSAGSASCFVDSPVPVALCGVEGLIVVVRDGTDGRPPAILIAKKGDSQRVKEITAIIEADGRRTLL